MKNDITYVYNVLWQLRYFVLPMCILTITYETLYIQCTLSVSSNLLVLVLKRCSAMLMWHLCIAVYCLVISL